MIGVSVSSSSIAINKSRSSSPGIIKFRDSSSSVNEGDGTATIPIDRINGSSGATLVTINVPAGDVRLMPGVYPVTFGDGVTTQNLSLMVMENPLNQGDILTAIEIVNAGTATIGDQAVHNLTVVE